MSSRRGYLTIDDLEQFADITVTDDTEAEDQISQAEEMIDDYVGYQDKLLSRSITGRASAADAGSLTLETYMISAYQNTIDYFAGLHCEIIGGTGIGQIRKITASSVTGVLTFESDFSPALDATSMYKIYQLGKFPRCKDQFLNSREIPNRLYKSIPEEIKRATAAQMQYVIEMGPAFFASNGEETSESIGDYSVTKKSGGGVNSLIAPKARQLLRGIMNRTGRLVA